MGSSVVLMQQLVQPGCKLDPCNDLGYKLKGKDFFKWGFVVIFFFFFFSLSSFHCSGFQCCLTNSATERTVNCNEEKIENGKG